MTDRIEAIANRLLQHYVLISAETGRLLDKGEVVAALMEAIGEGQLAPAALASEATIASQPAKVWNSKYLWERAMAFDRARAAAEKARS